MARQSRSYRATNSSIFLHKDRKTFYHRSCIPKRLRALLNGRTQIWRSLKTEKPDEAALRSLQWDLRIQRLFGALKSQGAFMTNEQIEALVEHWLERALDEAEDYRAVSGPVSDDYRDDVSLILDDQFQEASEALVSCDYRKIEKEVDDMLTTAGLPLLDHRSVGFGRLCRRLLNAKQDYSRIESDRWEGVGYPHRSAPRLPQPHWSVQPEGEGRGRSQQPAPAPAKGPLFSKAIEKYLIDNPRSPRSIRPWQTELLTFLKVIGGDRPIDRVTKADCRLYKENLIDARKLNFATVAKHLSSLSGIFRWAEGQGYLHDDAQNPVRGLAPANKHVLKQRLQRRPFTDAELLQVLGSWTFLKQRMQHPERYWIILLCLFQMSRRDEAAQLACSDILEVDGLPCMRINVDEEEVPGQHVKNDGTKRIIPLHSSLIQIGFLEYVKTIRKQKSKQLFPALKAGPNGFGDRVTRFFGELCDKAGLSDKELVLHSLRMGGITKLHGAGCSESIAKVLTGHASNSVHGRVYVKRDLLPMSLLHQELEKLTYPAVVEALVEHKRKVESFE